MIFLSGFSSYNIDKTFWCGILSGTTFCYYLPYLGQYGFLLIENFIKIQFCHLFEFLKALMKSNDKLLNISNCRCVCGGGQ